MNRLECRLAGTMITADGKKRPERSLRTLDNQSGYDQINCAGSDAFSWSINIYCFNIHLITKYQ